MFLNDNRHVLLFFFNGVCSGEEYSDHKPGGEGTWWIQVYMWLITRTPSLFTRNYHNIVNQLYPTQNKKLKKNTKNKTHMEKEMATHSSILAWKSPWTEEPGGLQSMGLHDWACVHEGGGR